MCIRDRLPTGNPVDTITVDCQEYEVSIVDAGNPLVFIAAEDLGLKGTETPDEIDNNNALMKVIERIRGMAAEKIGLVEKWDHAVSYTHLDVYKRQVLKTDRDQRA